MTRRSVMKDLLGGTSRAQAQGGVDFHHTTDPNSGLPTVGIGPQASATTEASSRNDSPEEGSAPATLRTTSPTLSSTVKSLKVARGHNAELDELKAKLTSLQDTLGNGASVVELDPEQIDSSFVADRMEGADEELAELVALIEKQGQLVPILVRPHPQHPDRYQVAFGHRRVKAAKQLGRKVKAVVSQLTNDELLVAQGQENSARLDLTYIERARFARTLMTHGYDTEFIKIALNVNKSQVSWFGKITDYIPPKVLDAIGRAPNIGRPRWLKLAETIREHRLDEQAEQIAQNPEFLKLGSDDRFAYLADGIVKRPSTAESKAWSDPDGRELASFTYSDKRCTVHFDRRNDPDFADFLYTKLDDLYRDYKSSKAGVE